MALDKHIHIIDSTATRKCNVYAQFELNKRES